MSVIITTRLEANSTDCREANLRICNCHDVKQSSKGRKYHYCYLFRTQLEEWKRCGDCLAQEQDLDVSNIDRKSFLELIKDLNTKEKKGTKLYLKKLVSILNCEAGLKKYKITPAEYYQLKDISKNLLKYGHAEFISYRLCELLLELDFYVRSEGIGYYVREKECM